MSKVSVLMSTYNRPQWVGMSAESVLSQDCDLELLIVDHGSGPETAIELDKITDPRCKKYRIEENWSQGNPWAYLSRFATGDYLVIFTDDDLMVPGTMRRKVEFMDAHPSIGMAFTPVMQMNEHGENVEKSSIGRPYECDMETQAVPFDTLIRANVVSMMSAIFRAELAPIACKLLNSDIGRTVYGDWALWLELASAADTAYINEESAIVRIHGGSDSSVRGIQCGEFLKSMLMVWEHWFGRGFVANSAQWDIMRVWYLSMAIATPDKDMEFLYDHVCRFEAFRDAHDPERPRHGRDNVA